MRLPIRARLTLASAGLVAVVVAALSVFVYLRFESGLLDAVDAGLRSRADAVLAAPGGPSVPATSAGAIVEPDEAFAQILDADGVVLESSAGLTGAVLRPEELAALRTARIVETTVATAEEPVPARVLAVPVGDGRVLAVGSSIDDQHEALERLATLLAVGGPVALVLVVAVIWLVVGAALRPVESMRAEAAEISASEPGRRLPVSPAGDELARLGETLNEMLERLEQALERERRFVDDASHELRTPLANLKAELDLALRRSRTATELEAALRSASEETDRLARLADDLLVLARADRGRLPVRREPVEVATLVSEAVEPFARRAGERGVAIEVLVSEELRADIDELRIRQAVGNLLDNALRHTPAGGRVTVEAGRRNGDLRLEVRDTGEGFPPGSVPGVFEAFARPDAARSRSDGGAGLGLTIVRAVAEAHGGTAAAANTPEGGATVVVTIPGSAEPDA
jgi:two-component system, OmpR family, sensor kinase